MDGGCVKRISPPVLTQISHTAGAVFFFYPERTIDVSNVLSRLVLVVPSPRLFAEEVTNRS